MILRFLGFRILHFTVEWERRMGLLFGSSEERKKCILKMVFEHVLVYYTVGFRHIIY